MSEYDEDMVIEVHPAFNPGAAVVTEGVCPLDVDVLRFHAASLKHDDLPLDDFLNTPAWYLAHLADRLEQILERFG